MAVIRVLRFRDQNGREPFTDWLDKLKDRSATDRILRRNRRLENGNLAIAEILVMEFSKSGIILVRDTGFTSGAMGTRS